MARNGTGTYNLPAGNPVVTGSTISSTWANNTLNDLATAMTGSIAKDGQTTPTGNLPMGGYAHTGVADATVRTMYGTAGQIQDSAFTYLTSPSGTNTMTATAALGMSAYVVGQRFTFVAPSTNTSACTLNINAIGAKSITKNGTTALDAGDIISGSLVQVVYDGTQFQLLNSTSALTVTQTIAPNVVATTQAIFDNSTKVATTGFVARAIGSMNGAVQYSGPATLTTADIGKMIVADSNGGTYTLPTLSSVVAGSVINITCQAAITIQPASGDTLYNQGFVSNITLSAGSEAQITYASGTWYVTSGEPLLRFSFPNLKSSNGYQKLPNGLILQWMTGSSTGSIGAQTNTTVTTNWPITFPNACLSAQVTATGGATLIGGATIISTSTTNIAVNFANCGTSASYSTSPVIFGIGY